MTGAKGFNPYGLRIYFRNSEYQKYEMHPGTAAPLILH